MYRLIDSYPSKPMRAEKIGQCQICGEGIFSDEEIWQSEKGEIYYCNKCIEEPAKRNEEIREAIKKYKEYIRKEIKKQLEVEQHV